MTDYGVISDVPASHATLPGQDLRHHRVPRCSWAPGQRRHREAHPGPLPLEDRSRVAHVQVGAHRCFDRLEFIVEFMKPYLESIGAKRGRLRSLSRWLRR